MKLNFFHNFPSEIDFEKDRFTPPHSTKNLMPINIDRIWKRASLSHDTESYFLYMLFFRKPPSKKMILHFSNLAKQLMYECASINNIRKQSNLSPTTLKTINLSENDVSSTNCVKKDGSHLRPHLNLWYKCLGNSKNPIWQLEFKFTFVA